MLDLNPWLSGRLVKRNGRIVVKYNTEHLSVDQVLNIHDHTRNEVQPSKFTSISDYGKTYNSFCVKKGNQLLNKDLPLFAINFILFDNSHFGLCVSLSHLLGDGHTFYSLYAMLSEAGTARALVAQRNEAFSGEITRISKITEDFMFSVGTIVGLISKMVVGNNPVCYARYVDSAMIQRMKTDHQSAFASEGGNTTPFISTNDIMTTKYLTATNCDVGLIAVNFRRRISLCTSAFSDNPHNDQMIHLTDEFAGNYEAVVAYQREDFSKPEFIRQSISPKSDGTNATYQSKSGTSPQGFFTRCQLSLTMLTNWASFYSHIEFFSPGTKTSSRHIIHLPMIDITSIPLHVGILFCPTKDKLALLTFEDPKWGDMQRLIQDSVVADVVSPF